MKLLLALFLGATAHAGDMAQFSATGTNNDAIIAALGVSTGALNATVSTLGVSTAAINSTVSTLGVSTGTLRTDMTSVGASTLTIQNNIGSSTNTLNNVKASTGTNGTITAMTAMKTFSVSSVTFTAGASVSKGNFDVGGSTLVVTGSNVGIGTVSPDAKLHVNGGAAGATMRMTNDGTNINSLLFAMDYDGTTNYAVIGQGTDGSLVLGGASSIASGHVFVTDAGNVGIGTASPGSKLHMSSGTLIVDGNAATKLQINGGRSHFNANNEPYALAIASGVLSTSIKAYIGAASDNVTPSALAHVFSDQSGTELMRLSYAGKLGIGTASPSQLLHVNQGSIFVAPNANTFLNATDGAVTADLSLQSAGVRVQSNTALLFTTNTNERMRIDSAGNVGIGTTSPAEKLTVEGSVKLGVGGTPLALISTGTYTPTLTNTTNIDGSTAYLCTYMRIGNLVNAQCSVDIDPTTAGAATILKFSLPIASAMTVVTDLGGSGGNTDGDGAFIDADPATDLGYMTFKPLSAINVGWTFTFQYTIK